MKLINLLLILVFSTVAQAQITPAEQQFISGENYLLNPGFENGRTNWTESGTAVDTLESSVVRFGARSYKIVATAQTVNLSQIVTKYAAQSAGQQGLVSAWIKSTSTIAQVCAVVDSVDTNCVTIEANNTWKEYVIPFVMGLTNNGIRIKSASDSATTYIDQAFVGVMPATMMPEISQSQILSFSQYGASCTFSRTATGYADFANVTACDSTPKDISSNYSGTLALTDTDNASFTLNNMPIGHYEITANVAYFESDAAAEVGCFRISDGTLFGSGTCQLDDNTIATNGVAKWSFYLDIASSKTIRIQGTDLSPLVFTDAQNRRLSWNIKYYPPKSKIYSGDTIYPHAQLVGTVKYNSAVLLNMSGTPMANNSMTVSTTGDVLNICSDWSLGTGAGCVTGNKAMGVSFIAVNRGTYEVCTTYNGYNTGAAANSDATTVSARTFTLGTGAAILTFESNQWAFATNYGDRRSVHEYCQRIENPTAGRVNYAMIGSGGTYSYPALFNNQALFTTVKYYPPKDNPIIGTFEGIEKCADDYECSDTFSAKMTDTGVISDENLDWINGNCSLTGTSLRNCTFKTGIFTTAPNCQVVSVTCESSNCGNDSVISAVSSTTLSIAGYKNDNTALSRVPTHIMCQKTGSDYKPKTAKAATTNEMMYVPNVTRPKTCYYAFGGASATLASPTVCAASPCVEVYDSCSAGTAPTRSGTGDYFDLTFANGTWKANTYINCRCMAYRTTSIETNDCSFLFVTGDNTWMTNASGGAVFNLNTADRTGANRDGYMSIECTADAP
jgi:hypothetical protein